MTPLDRVWTSQPQVPVRTYEPGAVVLWNPAVGLANLGSGAGPSVISSGMTRGVGLSGVNYSAVSITSSIAFPIPSLASAGTPFSLLHVFSWDGNANRASLAIGNAGFLIVTFSGGNLIVQVAANTINALTLALTSIPTRPDGSYAVALSYDGASLIGAVNGTSMGSYASANLGSTNSVTINPSDGVWQFGDLGARYLTMFSMVPRSTSWALQKSANPWSIFVKRSTPIFVGLSAPPVTVFYPYTDISVAGWSSNASSIAAAVNELTLDRSNYAWSPDLSTSAELSWGDGAGGAASIPVGTWDVQVDASYLGSSGQVRIVMLDAGGSTVGTSAWQVLTGSDATYTLSVTTTGVSTKFRYEEQA